MTAPAIKIVRGGAGYWVDVALETVPDVSREHVRIRWDAASRRFLARDLSSFGTTVDGVPLPPRPEGGGEGDEAPLPARATIGLAGAIGLAFEARA